jgi:hypothetical protein
MKLTAASSVILMCAEQEVCGVDQACAVIKLHNGVCY